jgi:hypothetical protein
MILSEYCAANQHADAKRKPRGNKALHLASFAAEHCKFRVRLQPDTFGPAEAGHIRSG